MTLSQDWRGEVWHEQQKPDEEAVTVANPEVAFELVRQTLRLFSGTHDAETQPDRLPGEDDLCSVSSKTAPPIATHQATLLLSTCCRIRESDLECSGRYRRGKHTAVDPPFHASGPPTS